MVGRLGDNPRQKCASSSRNIEGTIISSSALAEVVLGLPGFFLSLSIRAAGALSLGARTGRAGQGTAGWPQSAVKGPLAGPYRLSFIGLLQTWSFSVIPVCKVPCSSFGSEIVPTLMQQRRNLSPAGTFDPTCQRPPAAFPTWCCTSLSNISSPDGAADESGE